MHLFSPLLITVAKIPPVAYYPSKDVATYPDPECHSCRCCIFAGYHCILIDWMMFLPCSWRHQNNEAVLKGTTWEWLEKKIACIECMHWIYEISDQELKRTTKIVSAHFIIINHRIFEFSEGVTGNWQEGCMRTPVLRIVSGSTWRVTWIFDKKKPKLVSGGVGIPVLAVALICWKSLHVSRHACYCDEFKWCDVL